ncbi:hypothetical protein CLV24_11766 [Pontibacter ummariensis]|uniref:Uncharacterized protein n=2 Tax=Pontibacter ummariensis TaxID=1610492 RepID=A0A239IHZ6_9BACT|nr:hypothetical protein CLV24_11766 [Pontibacter ummariensis]SNS93270.1 hypothetical protein SAMN06296052_11766 [Pontibacter ummariensis]
MDLNNRETDNHRIGRELYNRDQDQKHRQDNDQERDRRYGNHNTSEWDSGNFFHTGPNPRGAQDRERDSYRRGGVRNSTYNQGQNAHLNDHYGSRPDSPYRNERAYLNHGDRAQQYNQNDEHYMRRPQQPGGALQGNRNEVNDYQNDQWREGPDSRSRYKEDDYRYGSGSHNWYREDRPYYESNESRRRREQDHRGFFQKLGDTWHDIWHSDDRNFQPRDRDRSPSEQTSSRERHGYEAYRNRNYNKAYENGPKWADPSDTQRDNESRDINRDQRYRR